MVDAKNKAIVKQAMFLFGGLDAGIQLPECAQNQKVWDVPPTGARGSGRIGSWGGHCVNLVDYDADGLTCVTWGATQKMTWRFLHTYCTELYAVLDETWTGPDKKAPNGFELAALQRDLRLVTRP